MVARNEFIQAATLRLFSSLRIADGLWESFHYIQQFIPLDEITAYFYQEQDEVLMRIARVDATQSSMEMAAKPLKIPRFIMFLHTDSARDDIRMVNDPDQDPLTMRLVRKELNADSSFIINRLALNTHQMGVLAFRADGKGCFEELHVKTLALLQQAFRQALLNGWQYREIEREKAQLLADRDYFQQEVGVPAENELIGKAFGLQAVMQRVRQLAKGRNSVLLTGEIGTGKQTIAREIHNLSSQQKGPLIYVRCGCIPQRKLAQVLFGEGKIDYDSNLRDTLGVIERANQGTVYLDEVSILPLPVQDRLLKLLKEKKALRNRKYRSESIDVRCIAATRRDLSAWVAKGHFNHDLYESLNSSVIKIPPLRKRARDIPSLAHHFIRLKAKEIALRRKPEIDPQGIERLMAYEWPGNVQELKYVVERELFNNLEGPLTFTGLERRPQAVEPPVPSLAEQSVTALEQVERDHIQRVLETTNGRIEGKGGAAELLDMHPSTLRHRLRKLKIPFGRKSKK